MQLKSKGIEELNNFFKEELKHLGLPLLEQLRTVMVNRTSRKALVWIVGEFLGNLYETYWFSSMYDTFFDQTNKNFYVLKKTVTNHTHNYVVLKNNFNVDYLCEYHKTAFPVKCTFPSKTCYSKLGSQFYQFSVCCGLNSILDSKSASSPTIQKAIKIYEERYWSPFDLRISRPILIYLHSYNKLDGKLEPQYHIFSTIDRFPAIQEMIKQRPIVNSRFLKIDSYIFVDLIEKSLLSFTHLIPEKCLELSWEPLPYFQVYIIDQEKNCLYRNDPNKLKFYHHKTGATSNLFDHAKGFKYSLNMKSIEDSKDSENTIIVTEDLAKKSLHVLVIRYAAAIKDEYTTKFAGYYDVLSQLKVNPETMKEAGYLGLRESKYLSELLLEDKIVWASDDKRFYLVKKCQKIEKEGRRGKAMISYNSKN